MSEITDLVEFMSVTSKGKGKKIQRRTVSLHYLKKQEICHSQYRDDPFHLNLGGGSAGWFFEHTEKVKETKIMTFSLEQ